jgi:hypothetical protein
MRTLYTVLILLAMLSMFAGASYAVEEPAVEEPAVEEPAVEEPAVEEPAVEEPAVEEPAVEGVDVTLDAEFEALLLDEDEEMIYRFPDIKPEYFLSLGYRAVTFSGSRSTGEYEYLQNSMMFGGSVRIFEFPHRAYLMIDEKSMKDYFGDMRYAYGDAIFFRWLGRALYHNTGKINLKDLDPFTASPGVDISKDTTDDYGRTMAADTLFLRLKVPHYAAHMFADYYSIRKDGTLQQRGLLGSGYYNNAVRASWDRDINWDGNLYKVGVNSHLGPVEAEYIYSQKSFDPGTEDLYDQYDINGYRPAGTYPHHRIARLDGFSNTLKLHTSYTGRLVASATVSLKERENVSSNTKADYLVGTGGVTWIPITSLTVFLKYKHMEIRRDNPETVTIEDTGSTYYKTYNVKPSIDTSTDTVSLTGRYRPVRNITLRGRYLYEDTGRKNAEMWGVEKDTQKNEVSFSADIELPGNLDLNAEYTGTYVQDPAYNTQSDEMNEGVVSLAWVPLPTMNTSLSYTMGRGKRENLLYEDSAGATDREVKSDKVFWTGTSLLGKNLSLTAAYTYLRSETIQDLVVESTVARDTSYTDTAHCYFLGADYSPVERLGLHGGAAFAVSKGELGTDSSVFLAPIAVTRFLNYKFAEIVLTAAGDYRFNRGLNAGLEYKYIELDEDLENQYDDVEDGNVQIVMVRLSKKWQ